MALLVAAPCARAADLPPAPRTLVTDQAGVLSGAVREQIEQRLAAHEVGSGQQVLLWIGRGTGGAAVEDWVARVFAAWRVGRAGLDDGVVIFGFVDDRKLRIEVGYGLESRLPDVTASRILREVMVPRVRVGDWDGAARTGVDAVLKVLAGGAGPATEQGRDRLELSWWQIALAAAAALLFLILLITHPSLAVQLLFTIAAGGLPGNRRSGGMGGGGFRGGGGRSGGGGATASW